ncbi:protein SSUH2 homolog [Watersipora subatra]|uniref:protein SSUH2 homolog n=1 Tax=Watersipora subatra TaxID=2589382 RepID=UPI00355B0D0B
MSTEDKGPTLETAPVIIDESFVDTELIEPERMEFGSSANITRVEARHALIEYVGQFCCYGKSAAKELMILKVVPSNAMHYTLETFCEGRFTTRGEIPHRGGAVDGAVNGRSPDPWSIRVNASEEFVDEAKALRIPHTSEIKICSDCRGTRTQPCYTCSGSGHERCDSCGGSGQNVTEDSDGNRMTRNCSNCGGKGECRCGYCNGSGTRQCSDCEGYGKVEVFDQLNIRYKNHIADYVLEGANLPSVLVRSVEGVEIFSQTDRKVWPITQFPVAEINQHSVELVNRARKEHSMERQLQQKQSLCAVPVTRIDYEFRGFTSSFWVYGLQRKVYAPDYPQQKCCGCNIL